MNLRRDDGVALWGQQMRALFVKRFLHSWRNRILTLCQILIPMAFALIALVVLKTLPDPSDSPPIDLTTNSLLHNIAPYEASMFLPEIGRQLVQDYGNSLNHPISVQPKEVADLDRLLLILLVTCIY